MNATFTTMVQPHVYALAVIACRLVPVALLCPLWGGEKAPNHVKLSLVFAFAGFLHWSGGISVSPIHDVWTLARLALQEILLGTTLGLISALPFDAARMGGRMIDTFRGSSAEAALPLMGSKEAATGDLLYQLVLALSASGLVMPVVVSALFRSFRLVPLGGFSHTEDVALNVAALIGTSFGTGLAIGAPIAGISLLVDAAIGLAGRAAPNIGVQEFAVPVRILAGGGTLCLLLGVIAERMLAYASNAEMSLMNIMHLP